MLPKTQLDYLQDEVGKLGSKKRISCKELEKLESEKSFILKGINALQNKTSQLSENLLQKKMEELDSTTTKITDTQQELKQCEEELNRYLSIINKIQTHNPSLYVEVVQIMAKRFWDYVKNDMENPYYNGKKTFYFMWFEYIKSYNGYEVIEPMPDLGILDSEMVAYVVYECFYLDKYQIQYASHL